MHLFSVTMKYEGVVGAARGVRTGTRKVGKKQRNGDLKIETEVKVTDVIKKKIDESWNIEYYWF